MNNEFQLLIKKHSDTLVEQTKTKPQETLDFKVNKQMETFSFSPTLNSVEERKWLSAVSSFEATISVFDITIENNSFFNNHTKYRKSNSAAKTVDELNRFS